MKNGNRNKPPLIAASPSHHIYVARSRSTSSIDLSPLFLSSSSRLSQSHTIPTLSRLTRPTIRQQNLGQCRINPRIESNRIQPTNLDINRTLVIHENLPHLILLSVLDLEI